MLPSAGGRGTSTIIIIIIIAFLYPNSQNSGTDISLLVVSHGPAHGIQAQISHGHTLRRTILIRRDLWAGKIPFTFNLDQTLKAVWNKKSVCVYEVCGSFKRWGVVVSGGWG